MKFFQKYGWVIDFVAMAFILFIGGVAIAVHAVPLNYFIEALTISSIISLLIPFMVYRYDESGVRESVIITTITSVMHKLAFKPEVKQQEQILTIKTKST